MIAKKYIIHCFTATCILLFGISNLNAQRRTKDLTINIVGGDLYGIDKLSYSLLRGNTIISIVPIDKKHTFSKIHQVTCGTYSIEIYKNDSLFQTYPNITVDCYLPTRFYIRLDNQTSYSLLDNVTERVNTKTNNYNEVDGIFGFYYTQNILDTNANFVQHFGRYRMGFNINHPVGKYFSYGYNYSASLAFSYPDNNKPLIDSIADSKERYSYLSFDIGLYIRLSTFNQTKTNKGFSLDIGINYQAPLLFRHSSIFENHKLITRYIHRWNDLETYVRIKRKFFSLFGGYRIFDYIKYNYPQNPKLIFGFELTAPID